jgi:4'-phosphopantetheinyl transferase
MENMVVSWKTPTGDFSLSKKDIHLWRADLSLPDRSIQQFNQILSNDEKMKAERFHFEKDRKKFIIGVGILRTILGCYIGVEPCELRFCFGKHGKPGLSDAFGNKKIHFNMSHSEDLALYGFTRDHEIGLDIEFIRDIPEMDKIAEQFFSIKENDVLRSLPDNKKKEAFFNCWTRKEAFIKAIGEGLSYPLSKLAVSLTPDEPSRVLTIDEDSERASKWFMWSLRPALGFTAAFAIQGHDWRLHFWQWPGQPTCN